MLLQQRTQRFGRQHLHGLCTPVLESSWLCKLIIDFLGIAHSRQSVFGGFLLRTNVIELDPGVEIPV